MTASYRDSNANPSRSIRPAMLRDFHVADFFTLANGLCGVVAIFQAMHFIADGDPRHLYFAALLIPIALVLDVLDGRIARARHTASALGRELDSLADIVSFGVAPAAIAYAVGLNSPLDQALLAFFVLCGVSRLARFNVLAQSQAAAGETLKYFEGTPIPTSVIPLGLTIVAFYYNVLLPLEWQGVRLHGVALLFFVSGCLMVTRSLRIPKL